MARRLRVALLFGGRSAEHEVSVVSAASVARALDPTRYEVVPVGITREGDWVTGEALQGILARGELRPLPEGVGERVVPLPFPERRAFLVWRESGAVEELPVDVAFPVLHGPLGEDGAVQGLLELAGIPYVGSGVAASAVGMDKALMKALFRAAGLPVVPYRVVRQGRYRSAPAAVHREVEEALGYPCFVKPANLGSSVGVSRVDGRAGLAPAFAEAFRYDVKVLVERAAEGCREIECSVLGGEEPEASVPGEVVPHRAFYDYRAKYLEEGSRLIVPAELSPGIARRIRELACQAFTAIDAWGMARVDFFVDPRGGWLFVNEINTIPGFTPVSMYPKLWEASGLPYSRLVDRLVELALARVAGHPRWSGLRLRKGDNDGNGHPGSLGSAGDQ